MTCGNKAAAAHHEHCVLENRASHEGRRGTTRASEGSSPASKEHLVFTVKLKPNRSVNFIRKL